MNATMYYERGDGGPFHKMRLYTHPNDPNVAWLVFEDGYQGNVTITLNREQLAELAAKAGTFNWVPDKRFTAVQSPEIQQEVATSGNQGGES